MGKQNIEDYNTQKVGRHWPLPSVTATLLLVPLEKSPVTWPRCDTPTKTEMWHLGWKLERRLKKEIPKKVRGKQPVDAQKKKTTIQEVCWVIVRQSWNDPPAHSFTVQRVCTPKVHHLKRPSDANFWYQPGRTGPAWWNLQGTDGHRQDIPVDYLANFSCFKRRVLRPQLLHFKCPNVCHPKISITKNHPKSGTQLEPPSAVEIEVGTTSGTSGPGCSIWSSTGSSHLYCLDFWIQPVISDVDSLVWKNSETEIMCVCVRVDVQSWLMMFDDVQSWLMMFDDVQSWLMMFDDVQLWLMMFDDAFWYFIVFDDVFWYFMMFDVFLWYFMMFHGFCLIFHDTSRYLMMFRSLDASNDFPNFPRVLALQKTIWLTCQAAEEMERKFGFFLPVSQVPGYQTLHFPRSFQYATYKCYIDTYRYYSLQVFCDNSCWVKQHG